MTVYGFGLEEHVDSGTGTIENNTYYYSLAGRLIGELTGTTPSTSIFLTDALGSVLTTFSTAAGTAKVLANQVYGPYGTQRYTSGTMGTAKGFTGQYNDPFTGLDYYNARYYDPVVGVFVSADTVQGNPQGMNPYAYVGGNPETKNDPTGNVVVCPDSCGGGPPPPPPPPTGCTSGCKSSGPPTPTPGNCGGNLTAAQCAKGGQSKQNDISNLQGWITWLKIGVSGFTLLADIYQLAKDWNEQTGFSKIIELLGNAISIVGDVLSIVSQIASAFHSAAIQTVADKIGWIFNTVATVYKAARSVIHTPWGALVQMGIVVAFYSLRVALFGGSLTGLIAPLLFQIAEKATGFDLKKVFQAGGSGFQAMWQYSQSQVDVLNGESIPQYCQSNPGKC